MPAQFRDVVRAVLQHVEEVVGQVDVALVQLLDEHDLGQLVRQQGGAEQAQPHESPIRAQVPPSRAADGVPGAASGAASPDGAAGPRDAWARSMAAYS
ncbi:hypothetical protein [Streptomyces sp900105755]|uniref:Uncharacterized protein n=1 Tax=Streptomyces sp. 900105755 TaxID=3154389 RepID=A0ABV1TWI1_9ACTN